MKLLYMLVGTLLLMSAFGIASYVFSHKQLVSMQNKIDSSWVQIEKLQSQKKIKDNDTKSINQKLNVASTQYNRLVDNFNASIKRFPGSYIAENNDMHPRIYFEIKDEK
ncbi:MAG: LemA family protein [Gammaproteobacteria bacterium]|nr:LemA family protein [Gammaproteobacteria bacterium]